MSSLDILHSVKLAVLVALGSLLFAFVRLVSYLSSQTFNASSYCSTILDFYRSTLIYGGHVISPASFLENKFRCF